MNRHTIIAVAVALSIASCSKKKDTISTNNPPGNNTGTIPTASTTPSSAFHQFVDTFKGYVEEASRYYYPNDSAIYFYIHHFTKDSFSLISETAFLGDEMGNKFVVNSRLKISDSGRYNMSFYMNYGQLTLTGNSMVFKWAYRYEVAKMPSGGVHSESLYVYGTKVGTSTVR